MERKAVIWAICETGENQRSEETWTWLKEGKLKRETEVLIVAAQDQAIRTNYVKATIDMSQADPKCKVMRPSTTAHAGTKRI